MGIDHPSALKSFIRYFKDHPATFAKSPDSKAFTVGGKRYHYDDLTSLDKLFDTKAVLTYELTDWWKAPGEEKLEWFTNFVEGTFRKEAMDMKRGKEELRQRLKANGKTDLILPDAEYILTHLQSFRFLGEIRNESGFRFWDTKKNQPTPYDYYSVRAALKSAHVEKDLIEQFLHQILHATECYDPHGNYGLTPMPETNNVYQVNLYTLPNWRMLPIEPELPAEIGQLMAHLFPAKECREFVYSWIYHSLTSRCGTYLYLCGGQGSGKNTLAHIIAALHGPTNASNPKQDSIYGRFNQYLKHRRFVFFDEFNCRTRQDKDTLKRIINDKIQIEAKGKDQEDIDVHASYFIANNSLEAIGIDPVDRRFSVPNVTHESIVKNLGENFIPELLGCLSDEEYIAKFGNWILHEYRDTAWSSQRAYQKERFEEIVVTTARAGVSEILSKVFKCEQGDYDYTEEKDSFKRQHKGVHYPAMLDWLKFFTDVKWGGEPLGEVKGQKFIPREEFRVAKT